MDDRRFLIQVIALYGAFKEMAESAVAQVTDEQFFDPAGTPHSLAVQLKHVGGNLRSRWRDVLTTDGEKRDRQRETEFTTEGESKADVFAAWERGWAVLRASLEALTPDDLERTITIRGQPHLLVEALLRSLNHTTYHVGQIVQLARTHAGDAWVSLSIPPGESDATNARMAERYGDWWSAEDDEAGAG